MQLDTTDIYTKKTLGEITRVFLLFFTLICIDFYYNINILCKYLTLLSY